MNKFFYSLFVIIIASITSVNAQSREYTTDSLSMYTSYSNDIFYSIGDGEVANIPRAGWDIAFYTSAMSAGIIINEGVGTQLYAYPVGDTSSWASIDTTGFSTWKPLYNSPENWEDGAFNKGASNHPDYGWGIYNSVTHNVVGDSLYVINLPDAGLKKIWIVNKISIENTYNIKFADIDGSNEQTVSIDAKPYVAKNFIYYSISTNTIIDREPDLDWDILFTKYIDSTENMAGQMEEYLVTGATNNVGHVANKFTEVGVDFNNWASLPFVSLKNTIGYNWKSIDMNTFTWEIDDSTAFFVKNKEDDVYKLIFTYWAGSGSGDFALNKELVSIASVNNLGESEDIVSLYPNPATQSVVIDINKPNFEGNIIIHDITGRIAYNSTVMGSEVIDISEFTSGIYFVVIHNQEYREIQKLIIK